MLKSTELTDAIETAFQAVWLEVKKSPATGPPEDRRILFEAVARGLLAYLKEHEELITSLSVKDGGAAKTLQVEVTKLGIEK